MGSSYYFFLFGASLGGDFFFNKDPFLEGGGFFLQGETFLSGGRRGAIVKINKNILFSNSSHHVCFETLQCLKKRMVQKKIDHLIHEGEKRFDVFSRVGGGFFSKIWEVGSIFFENKEFWEEKFLCLFFFGGDLSLTEDPFFRMGPFFEGKPFFFCKGPFFYSFFVKKEA